MNHQVVRYHDISVGHRVTGHEGKCRHLHGHNYRVHFTCISERYSPKLEHLELDHIGRVIDFSQIKSRLCMWLEDNWDHKFLAWEKDPVMSIIVQDMQNESVADVDTILRESVVFVPFNPTAENMAEYLTLVIGPQQLKDTGIRLTSVRIEETAKCHAVFSL